MVQGMLGAALALVGLAVGFSFAAPKLEPLMTVTLGLARIDFLPVTQMVAIAAAGTVLGALGGLLARGRREA
jgi:cell division protein FtsX